MRCKFTLNSITRRTGSVPKVGDDGKVGYVPGETWSLEFSPVYGNGDPNHENTKFWQASPSGQFTLGTVNKAAVDSLELGREYYLDITPAG